jgi:hypothetical protein
MNNVSVTSRRKKHAKRGKLQFQFLSPATSFFGLKLAHASSFAIFEAFPEIKAGIFGVDETLTIGVNEAARVDKAVGVAAIINTSYLCHAHKVEIMTAHTRHARIAIQHGL